MKRKTFLTTLIGGLALLPVAIKEAVAQLRKPKLSIKDGDAWVDIKPVESLDYDTEWKSISHIEVIPGPSFHRSKI